MSLRKRVIQGSGAMALGQIVGQGSVFVRNIVIARILTREQFGIAATFALTIALLEMISNLAVDRLLVQAEDGDEPRFQATAHLFQFGRGILNAIGLLLVAAPVANLFEVPEATWAFRMLAIVPLLRGMVHLDMRRLHRVMRFGPEVVVESLSQVIPTLIAWPLAIWLDSYVVVLWLLVVQVGVQLILSHAMAERPYRWAMEGKFLRRMFRFGGPLLLDGLLLFGIFQGDRLIVGASYGMDALGLYAVAFGLAFIPSLVVARILMSVFLPLLSQARDNDARFDHRYRICAQISMIVAAVTAAGFILVGRETVVLLYGEKYADIGALVAWLGVSHALRMLRIPALLAAMSRADTRTLLESNIVRALAIGPAILAAGMGAPLEWIAISGLGGEAFALLAIGLLLQRRHGLSPQVLTGPTAFFVVAVGGALALGRLDLAGSPWWTAYLLLIPAGLAIGAGGFALPELRHELCRLIHLKVHPVGVVEIER